MYEVYRQKGTPQVDGWQFICETEDDAEPGRYDWNKIVRALTDETVRQQSDRHIWWKVVSRHCCV